MKSIYKINRIIKSFALIAFLGIISSCDNDVTDLQPFDRITEDLAFSTPARIELSMAGVYDAAQSGFYLGGQVRGYPFGAANTQQGDMRGEDMLNVAAFYAITYENNYNPGTANNVFMWNTLYGVVNKANLVIEGVTKAIESGVVTAEAGNAYIGEARFLRALSHHELLVHFARPYAHTSDASHPGVPYRLVPVNTGSAVDSEIQKGRNTVAECYTLLLEDLQFAEDNLPATRAGALKVTRAVKSAAIALKSRVQLHKRDFAAVITESNKLIVDNVGTHALTAEPEGPFANNNNAESIFSVEHSEADNAGVNGSVSAMYTTAPGRALIAISPIMFNHPDWLETDKRRSQLTEGVANGFFTKKYRAKATRTDWNPILRLAEVYLNAAEAYSRTGNTAKGLEYLNAVRNRAVAEADRFEASDFADAKALTAAIIFERRVELLAEGRRWADIHRLGLDPDFNTGGIPSKVAFGSTTLASWGYGLNYENGQYTGTRSIQSRPYDDFRFVWPIPLDEINNNPVLREQQNPGY